MERAQGQIYCCFIFRLVFPLSWPWCRKLVEPTPNTRLKGWPLQAKYQDYKSGQGHSPKICDQNYVFWQIQNDHFYHFTFLSFILFNLLNVSLCVLNEFYTYRRVELYCDIPNSFNLLNVSMCVLWQPLPYMDKTVLVLLYTYFSAMNDYSVMVSFVHVIQISTSNSDLKIKQ